VLKYPDGGFLLLMALAMAVEGSAFGLIQPYVISGPHDRTFSIVFTVAFGGFFLAGAYYLAKAFAWLLARRTPPQP
jgi:hypothetical protein